MIDCKFLLHVCVNVVMYMYIHVCMCVAPPIIAGAWLMAMMLWQHFE